MNKERKNEQGFTLIEIIIVLVLLGILAATAAPKYFDLQATANIRAAQAAVAELQAQVNMTFAQNLLNGSSCSDARSAGEAPKGLKNLIGDITISEGWTATTAMDGDTLTVSNLVGPSSTTPVDWAKANITAPTIKLPDCK